MPPPPVHATAGNGQRPRIVVVGAGHGGIEAVRALCKVPADVLLVDRRNYHKFQPLLYQVATAGLMAGNIVQPVRHIFHRQTNFEFRLDRVEDVDLGNRLLYVTAGPPIGYDYLILAPGASTTYFGVEGAQEHGLPLKNLSDALNLRVHVLQRFEMADCNPALLEDGALTFVIVGGGPTGVELAGALRELFDHVLTQDFPALDVERARIIMIEMMDNVLPGYAAPLRDYARRQLEKMRVEVRVETTVEHVTADDVRLAGGEVIRTQSLIWAAGVKANPLADRLGVEQVKGGRVKVNEYLQVPGHPEVYVVGDMSGAEDSDGQLYPQLAPVAMQQGEHVARSIANLLAGKPLQPFRYKNRGVMATIGRNAAAVEFASGRTMTGGLAWLAWVFVHIVQLIGFRNQIGVLTNWMYNYFTWDRGPRLIIRAQAETDELPEVREEAVTDH